MPAASHWDSWHVASNPVIQLFRNFVSAAMLSEWLEQVKEEVYEPDQEVLLP